MITYIILHDCKELSTCSVHKPCLFRPQDSKFPELAVARKKIHFLIKGSLVGETSVLRTFRISGKELVKERVSQGKVS